MKSHRSSSLPIFVADEIARITTSPDGSTNDQLSALAYCLCHLLAYGAVPGREDQASRTIDRGILPGFRPADRFHANAANGDPVFRRLFFFTFLAK